MLKDVGERKNSSIRYFHSQNIFAVCGRWITLLFTLTVSFVASTLLIILPLSENAHAIIFGSELDERQYITGDLTSDTKISDPDNWQTLLALRGDNVGPCSAFVVGRRAILTAAHCLGDKKHGVVELQNHTFSVTCTPHPLFSSSGSPRDISSDFALCLSNHALPFGKFERINTDPDLIAPGDIVQMVGFGCKLAKGLGEAFGAFGLGNAKVFRSMAKNEDFGLIGTVGSAVCPGDGGGGVFFSQEKNSKERIQVGVISAGDLTTLSLHGFTGSAIFSNWASHWSQENNAGICGLTDNEADCSQNPIPAMPKERLYLGDNIEFRIFRPEGRKQTFGADDSKLVSIVVSYEPGDSVQKIVEKACGQQGKFYYDKLIKSSKNRLGIKLYRDSILNSFGELVIPDCPNTNSLKIINHEIRAGDYPFKLYQTIAKGRESGWLDFKRPKNANAQKSEFAGSIASQYFFDVYKFLNPNPKYVKGAKVLVPLAPLEGTPEGSKAKAIRNTISVAKQGFNPNFAHTNAELQSAGKKCRASPASPHHPYNISDLLDLLLVNKAARGDERPDKVKIMIPDSGLYAKQLSHMFPKSLLDKTGYHDWNNYYFHTKPIAEAHELQHGTQVASLILGGPIFSRLQALSDSNQRFSIIVRSIYKVYESNGRIGLDPDKLKQIEKLARTFTGIVNLSFKSYDPIPELDDEHVKGQEETILYVVAAGNNDGRIRLDKNNDIYPAVYGGSTRPGSKNVLTVAALEPDGKLAPFSNFGSKFVEIGAPGCELPTTSYNKQTGASLLHINGTSVAAPLVTFTAAMIKYEHGGVLEPKLIKRRLLSSADIIPELHKKELVADGRRLNVIKALSIFHDVIEKDEKLIRGKILFIDKKKNKEIEENTQFVHFCRSVTIYPSQILKIVPNFTRKNGEKRLLLYYKEQSDDASVLVRETCDLSSVGFRLRFIPESGPESPILLKDITDIVRAKF